MLTNSPSFLLDDEREANAESLSQCVLRVVETGSKFLDFKLVSSVSIESHLLCQACIHQLSPVLC